MLLVGRARAACARSSSSSFAPKAIKTSHAARFSTSAPQLKKVAIVVGSFERGYALDAARKIRALAPSTSVLQVGEPQLGADVDFDSLAEVHILILCTSSQNGFPPATLANFSLQLQLAAQFGAENCLSHLQHTVWGEGDPRWHETFMNCPREMDALLERCGSRRFFARGEANEPHAIVDAARCDVDKWAVGMWAAASSVPALGEGRAAPPHVPWGAQWAGGRSSPVHQRMRSFGLEALVRRHGGLRGSPSRFARPDAAYEEMIARVVHEQEALDAARKARIAKRRAQAAAKKRDAA